jgi:hypothetical protein
MAKDKLFVSSFGREIEGNYDEEEFSGLEEDLETEEETEEAEEEEEEDNDGWEEE